MPRASHGVSDAMVASLRDSRIRLGETSVGKCAEQRAPFQMPDVELMREGTGCAICCCAKACARVLAVPLLREERVIGALVIRRKVAGEFSPSVVTLLQTFAGQSVLAIQNARLFQRDQREEPAARGREPAQVAVPRQHAPRAAHAAQRDHRRDRDAARGCGRPEARGRARAARARAARRPSTCSR